MSETATVTREDVRSPWFTKREACEYLRISMDTLDRWIADGRVQIRKASGLPSVRLHKDDLDAVFQAPAPRRRARPKRFKGDALTGPHDTPQL